MSAAEAGAVEFDTDNLYFTITTGTVRKKVALFDDTSGAAGDTYYREAGTTGKLITLPAGTANQQLTMVSGYPAWRDTTYPTSAKTSNYSIGASDTVIFANAFSAAVTITLPTPSSFAGYRFYIKRIDSVYANACTVATAGGSIDGQPTFTLNIQYMSVMVVSDGTGWFIL
ncbi:MAG: hypothetical protein JWN33_187 [Candidatus Saccharibacteria bacterium]|nr:hypothetical protein [Candidatus Saccharibacteria bacterium]